MTEATVTRLQLIQECPLARRRTFSAAKGESLTYDIAQGVVYVHGLPGLAPSTALCYPMSSILSMEVSFEQEAGQVEIQVEAPKTKSGKAKAKP